MTDLSVDQHTLNDSMLRLALTGEVDLSTRDLLADALKNAITAGDVTDVLVDLGKITFLDAAGISALIEGRNLAAQYGVACLVTNPHGLVRRVLDITGVLRTLTDPPKLYLLP